MRKASRQQLFVPACDHGPNTKNLIFEVQVDILVLGILVHDAIGPSAHAHRAGPLRVKLGRAVA